MQAGFLHQICNSDRLVNIIVLLVIALLIIALLVTLFFCYKLVKSLMKSHWFYKRRHGLIQSAIWIFFACPLVALILSVKPDSLRMTDMFLILIVLFAFAVGVTVSQAYNEIPDSADPEPLYIQAIKKKNIWLHSYFSWECINAAMTVIPLYCTCAAIYISGTPEGNGEWDRTRILIYSILSLVLSLSIYVIRPANRATGYRRAYKTIDAALIQYKTERDRSLLSQALTKGEGHVSDQAILDPK